MANHLSTLIRRAWQAIAHPRIRLQADFPWGFGTMAKYYLIANFYYFLGSLAPLAVFIGALPLLPRFAPEFARNVVAPLLVNHQLGVIVVVSILSFLCGFGLEVWYINRVFRRNGLSLRQSLGLTLEPLGGGLRGLWGATWRAALMLVLALALEQLIGLLPIPAHNDPTAEFMASLSGLSYFGMALLAAVAAPIFEELVFRGFLFNICRTTFRRGRWLKLFRGSTAMADFAAVLASGAVFAAFHLNPWGFPALLVLGMLLAELYRRTGSLYSSMIMHCLNNTLAVILTYLTATHLH